MLPISTALDRFIVTSWLRYLTHTMVCPRPGGKAVQSDYVSAVHEPPKSDRLAASRFAACPCDACSGHVVGWEVKCAAYRELV